MKIKKNILHLFCNQLGFGFSLRSINYIENIANIFMKINKPESITLEVPIRIHTDIIQRIFLRISPSISAGYYIRLPSKTLPEIFWDRFLKFHHQFI